MVETLTLEQTVGIMGQARRTSRRIDLTQHQTGKSQEKSYEFPDIECCQRTPQPEKWMTIS